MDTDKLNTNTLTEKNKKLYLGEDNMSSTKFTMEIH